MSQYLYAAHLDDFNENTHTCERSTIKLDKRETIQDNFIDILSFPSEKFTETEKENITIGNMNIILHSKVTWNTSQHFNVTSGFVAM